MLCCWAKLHVCVCFALILIFIFPQDLDLEDEIPQRRQVDYAALEPYHKNDVEVKKQREEAKAQILYEKKGFCKEGGEGDGY